MAATTTYIKKFDTGSITKLNGENYRVWKIRLVSLFKTHRSLGVVEGTEARHATDADLQAEWDQKSGDAFTAVLMSMSDEQVEIISSCTTVQEIWRKLATMYESASGENKQLLWQKFYSVQTKDSPLKAMCEIQNLAAQLRSLKVAVDDEAVVARVITSMMDDRFRQFREAWRSVETKKQKSELLLNRLKIWELEETVSTSLSTSETHTKAFKAAPKVKKTKEEIAKLKKKSKCHKCGLKGHWQAECRKDKDAEVDQAHQSTVTRAFAVGNGDDVWYNDSGASQHHCGNLEWFTDYKEFDPPQRVQLADGSSAKISGTGTVRVKALMNKRWCDIELLDVQYIPGGANLFSENIMLRKGYNIEKTGGSTGTLVFMKNGKPIISAYFDGQIQMMNFRPIEKRALSCLPERWHERLAHVNAKSLADTAQQGAAYGLEGLKFHKLVCTPCQTAKSKAESYSSTEKEIKYEPGECVHADLVHANATSIAGFKYFLLIKDQGSNFRQTYFQKVKTETVENMIDGINFLTTQTGNKCKLVRFDNGTEFKNSKLSAYFSEKGIQQGFNAPHASQSNGLIERDVRTVQEAATAMLIEAQLDSGHWDDAVSTACYVLNRTLSSKNRKQTPFELIFKKKPSLHHVKIFGCKAFAHILDHKKKWSPKTRECILVGYSTMSKCYRLWVIAEKKYIEQARHVTFREDLMPVVAKRQTVTFTSEEKEVIVSKNEAAAQETPETESPMPTPEIVEEEIPDEQGIPRMASPPNIHDEDTLEVNASDEEMFEFTSAPSSPQKPIASRLRPETARKEPDRYKAAFLLKEEIPEPSTLQEAKDSKYWNEWLNGMELEINKQHANGTWIVVKRPQHARVLKNRWVFKTKISPLNQEVTFKARLVVKGFNQVEGIDFEETFAPVVRYESVRAILALAAAQNYNIIQFDVETAFLNSELEEETYMEQPQNFNMGSGMVCKLLKGLYGLKQAPRSWYRTLKKVLNDMGFNETHADPCVYVGSIDEQNIIIAVFVDDGLIVGEHKSTLEAVLASLKDNFSLTRQPLKKFLGMDIRISEKGIFLHQNAYIEIILKRYNMQDCKSAETPMQAGLQLEKAGQADMDLYEYPNLIGALLYISRCTRPDIAYAVSYLSRFLTCYGEEHWKAAKQILRYLQGTKEKGILYSRSKNEINAADALVGFVDADYASDKNSRKSTTGCMFQFNGSPISWFSKRQTCIALSSAEAEYVALTEAGKEATWLTQLYRDMDVPTDGPVVLKTDSQSAMILAHNPEHHPKTKHIAVKQHYIRHLVSSKVVELEHLPDVKQPADLLTKSVVKQKFQEKRDLLGMKEEEKSPPKRKMKSVVVVPKKAMFSFMLLLLMMIFQGGHAEKHSSGSAVLWRKSSYPVTVGFNTMKLSISLVSPCDLLPVEGFDKNIAQLLKQQCEEKYHVLFLNELEKFCPIETNKNKVGLVRTKRTKRFVMFVVASIIVVAILAPGISMGGYAIYKIHNLQDEQERLEERIDELEQQIFSAHTRSELLHKEITELAQTVDNLSKDVYLFKEKSVILNYVIAYITGRLLEGRNVLRETANVWKNGELNEKFFDYLNFTQPCGNKCPAKYGIFHSCVMSTDLKKITLQYSLPVVDEKLKIVEADPFTLLLKKQNKTCTLEYTGPKLAVISEEEDCIYSLNTERAPVGSLPLSPSLSCKKSLSFNADDKYFSKMKCEASHEDDERDFVQIKVYNNLYYIYCPGSTYMLGKRNVTCPQKIFTLPLTATFTVNKVEYKGSVLNIVYQQQEDPLFVDQITWHLDPHVEWDHLEKQVDKEWKELEKDLEKSQHSLNDLHGTSHYDWLIILIGILFFAVLIAAVVLKMRKKKTEKRKVFYSKVGSHAPAETPAEETAAVETVQRGPHVIIVE